MHCLLLLAGQLFADTSLAELPPPAGVGVVAPGARLELLYTRSAPIKGGLTEGPAVAPDEAASRVRRVLGAASGA